MTADQQKGELEPHEVSELPHSMPPYKRLKEDWRPVYLTLRDMSLHIQDDTAHGAYAPSQVLENESSTKVLKRKVKSCCEVKEFAVDVQRSRILMPTDMVKLLRKPTEGDVKPPRACYPGPLTDST